MNIDCYFVCGNRVFSSCRGHQGRQGLQAYLDPRERGWGHRHIDVCVWVFHNFYINVYVCVCTCVCIFSGFHREARHGGTSGPNRHVCKWFFSRADTRNGPAPLFHSTCTLSTEYTIHDQYIALRLNIYAKHWYVSLTKWSKCRTSYDNYTLLLLLLLLSCGPGLAAEFVRLIDNPILPSVVSCPIRASKGVRECVGLQVSLEKGYDHVCLTCVRSQGFITAPCADCVICDNHQRC